MSWSWMHKIAVTFTITSTFLFQGLLASACDHSVETEASASHCHSAEMAHESMDHGSGVSEKAPNNCPMCNTGQCFVDSDPFPLVSHDTTTEDSSDVAPWYLAPVSVYDSFQKHLRLSIRPPPVDILLPQLKNWQAFFSVFRN